MKAKNILLIMPYGSVGGMERLAYSFYNFYIKKGYSVKALKLIRLKDDIINFNENELYLSDIDFSQMSKFQRLKFYLSLPFKLRSVIKENNITHTISFGDMTNLFSSLTFTTDYKIASIHALKSVELSNDTIFSKMTKFGYRYTYKYLNKVVCISNAIKEDLIKKCQFKFVNKLTVIYNPHDLEEIQKKSNENIDNIDESQLLKTNSIIFLGRLSIQKAPWHLIKSFSLVLKDVPDSNLIIIGDGDTSVVNYVKQLIKELKIENNVHFFGRKSNPYKYLAKSKVLALSSHYEGTPNVIVEAIALEIPIACSCCTDGVIELMSLKGKTAINSLMEVEAGILTPNLYKGVLGIPIDNYYSEEEYILAEAVKKILDSDNYKKRLKINKTELLSKFDLKTVAYEYLNETEN